MTAWTRRLIFFMRTADISAAERRLLRRAFSRNGSGETEADEDKAFDNPAKFSLTGNDPAQVIAINTLAKPAILRALRVRADVLPQALWYVVGNETGVNDGVLLRTNDPDVTPAGQTWDWQDAIARVDALRGLKPIVEDVIY